MATYPLSSLLRLETSLAGRSLHSRWDLWRRDEAQLLHQGHDVFLVPYLNYLAVH